jgi:hypothetical protein
MTTKIRAFLSLALIALAALSFSPLPPASANGNDCKKAKGNLSVVNNGDGTTSGTITQGGKLNGTTQAVFTSALTATPDPSTFSYTGDFAVTTNKGVLKTHNVGIFDVVNGLFSEIARIDPNTSTGIFAGATGVLYINGKTTDAGATFQAEISGDICFAD